MGELVKQLELLLITTASNLKRLSKKREKAPKGAFFFIGLSVLFWFSSAFKGRNDNKNFKRDMMPLLSNEYD